MMKKVLVFVLVTVFCLGVAQSLRAEVQNVRIGGDIRIRAYGTQNLYNLNSDVDDDDFYFRQRTRVSAEADLTDNIWVVTTVEADGMWGRETVRMEDDGTYSKIDNDWDVNVAEAYLQMSEMFYSPLTLKLGRQYLNYGRGFLISSREWEYKFDAARAIMDFYPWTIDLIYSRLVETDNPADGGLGKAFDDTDLFGVNFMYEEDLWTMEGYVFGIRDEFDEEYRQTKNSPVAIGIRGDTSPVEALDFWGEFAYELGTYQTTAREDVGQDTRDIRAFAFDLGAVYVFDVTWEPAVAFSYTYASGDDDPGNVTDDDDYEAFNPFFNYNYYGQAYSPALSNIGIFNAQLSLLPSEDVTLILDFFYYQQNEEVAMSMGDPNQDNGGIRADTNGDDKDLGMELDVTLEYNYSEDLSTQFVFAWFKPGDAYETAANDEDPDDVFEGRLEFKVSF